MKFNIKIVFLSLFVSIAAAGSALAADCTTKVVAEDAKARLIDQICKPGEGSPLAKRPVRGVYFIEGGTLERVFEDGKKDTVTRHTGEAILLSEQTYAYTNTGTTTIHMVSTNTK